MIEFAAVSGRRFLNIAAAAVATAYISLLSVSPARADNVSDAAKACEQNQDPNLQIKGCTARGGVPAPAPAAPQTGSTPPQVAPPSAPTTPSTPPGGGGGPGLNLI